MYVCMVNDLVVPSGVLIGRYIKFGRTKPWTISSISDLHSTRSHNSSFFIDGRAWGKVDRVSAERGGAEKSGGGAEEKER